MTQQVCLAAFKRGVPYWNHWRRENHVGSIRLRRVKLSNALLADVNLRDANLRYATLSGADLSRSDLRGADLRNCDLRGANLRCANLSHVLLSGARLCDADLTQAIFEGTMFGQTDLSRTKGLESCVHYGRSVLDFRTVEIAGKLPSQFLLGCGLTPGILQELVLLLSGSSAYHSAFISYSHKDKQFATRLFHALTERSVRCWLDERSLEPGRDIKEGLHEGIASSEKIILCCSIHALSSSWVNSEIENALSIERQRLDVRKEQSPVLIPLDLDGHLHEWRGPRADEIRRRYAIDFTGIKRDSHKFGTQLERLVSALKIKSLFDACDLAG